MRFVFPGNSVAPPRVSNMTTAAPNPLAGNATG